MSHLHAPVFILAPPRSFSTVTTALIGGHSDLYALPEMLTFSCPTVGDLLAGVECICRRPPDIHPHDCGVLRARLSGPYRAIAQLHEGNQRPAAIKAARAWLEQRSEWRTEELMDHVLELIEPYVAVENSPDTVLFGDNLARCMTKYPNARYIHLTRHPVTAQTSIIRHIALLNPIMSVNDRRVRAASIWYLAHSRIVRSLRGLPPHRWMRLRGEDLLADPALWLGKVLGWLKVCSDPAMIQAMLRTEKWVFAGTGENGSLFGGDYKFMRAPEFRPRIEVTDGVIDPSGTLLPEMREMLGQLARGLGYGDVRWHRHAATKACSA
jgi:hypothetical protein